MKISLSWLQTYFSEPLPKPEKVSELFTMHAFELEGVEAVGADMVFDFKILPNRAHDCLGHDGIARELSVLNGIPLKKPTTYNLQPTTTKHTLSIMVEDSKKCRRYAGRIIENISVAESPVWLKERLEVIGQRSINNVVDITNYVMFATGQPMHAFDLDKLAKKGSEVDIIVRNAKTGEKLMTLDGKDIPLDETMLVIADSKKPLALAGIKGGKWAEVDSSTKNIVLESANFEPIGTRKTSQKVGIRTDSEKRFENEITPELAGRAMEKATALFSEFASTNETKIGEVVDVYPRKRKSYKVGVSVFEVNKLLGTKMTEADIKNILDKLCFEYEIVENPIERVLELAPKYIGAPYKLGASISYEAPEAFDCSSFTAFLFSNAGIQLPRFAVDQYVWAESIKPEEVVAGDLVFSANEGSNTLKYESVEFLPKTSVPKGVSHVGIILNKDEVIHASATKEKAVIEKLSESDRFKNITGFGRVTNGKGKRFVITTPVERLDLVSKRSFLVSGTTEDIIEEIGRVHGYEDISSGLPDAQTNAERTRNNAEGGAKNPEINKVFHYSNIIRETLQNLGFSEIMTYALTGDGEVELQNPMAEDKKFLRRELTPGIGGSLEMNAKNAPLLGVPQIKIFEIGKVFSGDGEHTSCALAVFEMKKNSAGKVVTQAKEALEKVFNVHLAVKPPSVNKDGSIWEFNFDELVEKLPEPAKYEIPETSNAVFKPISQYPFALRDIAVFVPSGTDENEVKQIIESEAGELLARNDLFDKFEKDGKISYAYHLVFQSYEKTLSDDELNGIIGKITEKLNNKTDWRGR